MRVGLISDTHGRLRPEVFTHFQGVDRILHAGDVGSPEILSDLAALAPVHAVHGNTDRYGVADVLPAQAELELEGWKVLVTHGHELGSPTPEALVRAYPGRDIIVHGHTHIPLLETFEGTLIVNPGAAGPARFRLLPSVAVMELSPGKRTVRHVAL
ncbi:MAG: metallophosphoesterase family protein [Gemmatimonadetes bacterium]|nr:metallophosphoesterase family protein [Gemmatimonadota bacterium]